MHVLLSGFVIALVNLHVGMLPQQIRFTIAVFTRNYNLILH
jgi:hypothetical protein